MIRSGYYTHKAEHLGGNGKGIAVREDWLKDEELPPNVRMITTITLPIDASVSLHNHEGEAEIYRILSGTGMYDNNGVETEVGPGFVTICYDGERHGLINTGTEPLVFDAVIVSQ
ncbi:MAG: cupin domain-containing protein [Clostridia bacterium]|nr:cupin domain-containing protein [Clostridia bacterium]